MARIRSVKPEFWSSPSTAHASAVARLAFIAMWNWADDHGRGTANLKELEGFIFPNDDIAELSHGNTVHFRDVVAEVSACFDVVFYEVHGRPFYEIPTWDTHQRNERRATQSKYFGPDDAGSVITPLTSTNAKSASATEAEERKHRASVTETPRISVTGTGEQGNRGTGEQSSSSVIADAIPDKVRLDVEAICDRLAGAIEANGIKKPNVTKAWRDAARLLIDKDGFTVPQIEWMIEWCQNDEFWRSNILSMPKLRAKFPQLKLKAIPSSAAKPKVDPNWALR